MEMVQNEGFVIINIEVDIVKKIIENRIRKQK